LCRPKWSKLTARPFPPGVPPASRRIFLGFAFFQHKT
jgi:hypothetical protein